MAQPCVIAGVLARQPLHTVKSRVALVASNAAQAGALRERLPPTRGLEQMSTKPEHASPVAGTVALK